PEQLFQHSNPVAVWRRSTSIPWKTAWSSHSSTSSPQTASAHPSSQSAPAATGQPSASLPVIQCGRPKQKRPPTPAPDPPAFEWRKRFESPHLTPLPMNGEGRLPLIPQVLVAGPTPPTTRRHTPSRSAMLPPPIGGSVGRGA